MRILLLLTTLIFLSSLQSYADVFQYEDDNGTVIMTDQPEKVPPKHLKKSKKMTETKTNSAINSPERITSKNGNSPLNHEKCDPNDGKFRLCKEYLNKSASELPSSIGKHEYVLLIGELCSDPLIQDRLTGQEKSMIRDNGLKISEAKTHVPSDKQYEIKMIPKMLASACKESEESENTKTYSRQELDNIGKTFTSYFRELGAALTTKDFKKAAGYYHDMVKDDWLKNYASLPKDELKKIAQAMQNDQVYVEQIEDDTRAVCQYLTNVDGQRYSFHLVFLRDNENNWKIFSM